MSRKKNKINRQIFLSDNDDLSGNCQTMACTTLKILPIYLTE